MPNTLANTRINSRQGPFMFPRVNSNFASGSYKPPSNNAAYQPMFQGTDPYAGSNVAQQAMAAARGMTFAGQNQYNGGMTSQLMAQRNAATGPTSNVAGTPMAVAGVQAMPQGSLRGLESFAGLTPEQAATVRSWNVNPNENQPIREASRLAAGAVSGNPYITQQGKEQMLRGFTPNMNAINPAFWQYTDPTIQKAMQGLYQSVGVRPESQAFMRGLWTPPSVGGGYGGFGGY